MPEPISDIVEFAKFQPGRGGRLLIRLLTHPDPVLVLYTGDDPIRGKAQVTVNGVPIIDHRQLVHLLADVPEGWRATVTFYPREDLSGCATRAEFVIGETPC